MIHNMHIIDIKDKFRIYRRDLADTLINPYFVLRDEMLDIIMQDASSLLNRWGSASSLGQVNGQPWYGVCGASTAVDSWEKNRNWKRPCFV